MHAGFRIAVSRLLFPLTALALLVVAPAAVAQDIFSNPTPATAGRRLPSDRELAFALYDAEQLLQTDRSLEALEALQSLWDEPSDTFLPNGETLRERLHRIFRGLSADNRDAYIRRYDSEAVRLVEQAVESGTPAPLEEAVRRYYFTRHGLIACQSLAMSLVDRGDLIGGARYLEQAADHPSAMNSRDLLLLAAQCWHIVGEGERVASIAERLGVDDIESSLAADTRWTTHPQSTEWLTFRQSPLTQSSRSAPVSPLGEIAWTSPTIEHEVLFFPGRTEEVQQLLAGFVRRITTDSQRHLIPVLQPIGVGELVILNSYSNTWAVDAATGELMWLSAEVDKAFGKLFSGDQYEPDAAQFQPLAELFLGQQAWRDLTKGTLSTDGARVYAIRDGGMVAGNPAHAGVIVNNRHPLLPCDYNRLMAFTADEGEFLWEAGGERDGVVDFFAPEMELVEAGKLEGLYFLGPPLPSEGRLFCLAEDRGEVGLYVLDAASGSPLWSLPLAQPYQSVSYDHDRRWAGLSPVLAGRILVCPTGDGTLIGVDVVTRSVQWVVEYQAPPSITPSDPLLARRIAAQGMSSVSLDRLLTHERWLDSVPMIDGRHVLYTPFDSRELYCFDLVDGTLSWVRPRGQSWFLGAVFDGKVLVVGQDGLTAVEIATGDDAWPEPVRLPPPAGRGVQSGQVFHLPLSTREIVTVDIPSGRILARSPLPEEADAGNLMALGDRLVMVTPLEIVGLSSLSEMETYIETELAADPMSLDALRMRGELRLHQNDIEQGLADLALPVDAGDRQARNLLAHQIAEGLRSDFEAYRERASEVADLIDDPERLREFSKTYVAALESHGEHAAAFEQLLKLAGEQPVDIEELIPDGRRVRADRWLNAWIARVRNQADDDQRPLLDSRVADLIATTDSPRTLRDVAVMMAGDPEVDRRIVARVNTFEPALDPLLREGMLLDAIERGQRFSDRELFDAAGVELLEFYRQQKNADGVTWMAESLSPLVESAGTQKARLAELLAALRSASVEESLIRENPWAGGELTVEEDDATAATIHIPIPVLGSTEGPLDGWTFLLESNLRNIYARDANGVLRWTVPSSLAGGNASHAARYVEVHGSLVLCVFSDRLLLIDALARPEARVIGSHSLVLDAEGSNGRSAVNRNQTSFRFRGPQANDPFNLPVGNVGPVTAQSLCFQAGNELIALDPDTGLIVWRKGELPPGCELIGDEEYLLVNAPLDDDEFLVYRMSDGEPLGARPCPDKDLLARPAELVNWGRCWLMESKEETGGVKLAMHDFIDEQDRWSVSLPEDSLWTTLDGTNIVTLTPEGRLGVLDHATGRELHALDVKLGGDWDRFSLHRHAAGWLLMGYRQPRGTTKLMSPGGLGAEVNGEVALIAPGFDEIRWTTDVPLQVYPSWQPTDWPVLVFACRRDGLRLMGNGIHGGQYFRIELLDAGTGERLYENEMSNPQQPVWDADLSQPRLEVRFGAKRVDAYIAAATPEEDGTDDAADDSEEAAPEQTEEPEPGHAGEPQADKPDEQ